MAKLVVCHFLFCYAVDGSTACTKAVKAAMSQNRKQYSPQLSHTIFKCDAHIHLTQYPSASFSPPNWDRRSSSSSSSLCFNWCQPQRCMTRPNDLSRLLSFVHLYLLLPSHYIDQAGICIACLTFIRTFLNTKVIWCSPHIEIVVLHRS